MLHRATPGLVLLCRRSGGFDVGRAGTGFGAAPGHRSPGFWPAAPSALQGAIKLTSIRNLINRGAQGAAICVSAERETAQPSGTRLFSSVIEPTGAAASASLSVSRKRLARLPRGPVPADRQLTSSLGRGK